MACRRENRLSSGRTLTSPILPAKLFHTGDRRKRLCVIGSEIAKAMRARTDRCYCPQFFVVEPAESNGNVVAPRFITMNHGCV